jgi:hypothetical protein
VKKSRLQSVKKRHKYYYSSKSRADQIFDLGDYEETVDRSFFKNVGQAAAQNAVNENKAMSLPITFLLDGWIVQRMPTGAIRKIVEVKTGNRKIAKGTILHVKRSDR